MDTWLGIAGVICIAMAVGHTAVGLKWVLPHITKEQFPQTPFPGSMNLSMVYVTWFIVTIFAGAIGGVLVTMAWAPDVSLRVAVLRWIAGLWAAAAAMAGAVVVSRSRGGSLSSVLRGALRLPVPLLWVAVAVICWIAST